jgi:hypothetical protein
LLLMFLFCCYISATLFHSPTPWKLRSFACLLLTK